MISDKVLINLKILAKIQKNGKICKSFHGIITLQESTTLEFIKRFYNGDSRRQTLQEIYQIISDTLVDFQAITNSKFLTDTRNDDDHIEYNKLCQDLSHLLDELQYARIGVSNLRFTYNNDFNTTAQLDVLLRKIDNILRDYNIIYTKLTSKDKLKEA